MGSKGAERKGRQLWGPKSCERSQREVEGEDVWVVRDHVCYGNAEGRSGW